MCQRCTTCQWMLYGITSYGANECGKAYTPGVYTRVTSFTDWINSVVGDDIPSESYPSCSSL